jgi:hypothetical protein
MAAPRRQPKPHFEVGKQKIPLIPFEHFKQGDVKLVEAVTGKDWFEWVKLAGTHAFSHPHVVQGFFAVAVQRARQATVEEVEAFIADLPLSAGIKLVFPEAAKGAGDADPPAEDETGTS